MDAVLQSFISGFPLLMAHSATAFVILVLGVRIYMLITPHDEMALIRDGNAAASLTLGGTILGIALPLAFVLAFSVSVFDIVLWGVVTVVLQLVAYFIVDMLLRNFSTRIEQGDMAAAILSVSIKLTSAAINAAAVSG
jgi:putative membrane protein